MIRIVSFAFILFFLGACSSAKKLTEQEINLFSSIRENEPLRILQITNREDSLLLRSISKNVNYKKDKIAIDQLIARLKTTMIAAPGIGLAAPQIGISRNIFIFRRIDKEGRPIEVAINPKIINFPESTICFENDGCLSIKGLRGNSKRYEWVEVEYINEAGKKIREKLVGYSRDSDFTAIVFQHEFDHLKGVLYIDKLCD
jgi:peptide deformylase